MIRDRYDTSAIVDRLQTTTGNKKEFVTHIALLACHIQPAQESITGDIAGGFGKDFIMFSDNVDIIEGDRVLVGTDEYRVMGTEGFNFNGHSHRETRIRIFKS